MTTGEIGEPHGYAGITEGRIVHVRPSGVDHCQPAVVVRHWGSGTCNLLVFPDGTNDGVGAFVRAGEGFGANWLTSLRFSTDPSAPGSWHWPERA